MHNLTPMRCACYARYSTDLQREESIEDQMRNLRNFAEARSWHILPGRVYADYGISGASIDRPMLKAMIAAALVKPVPFDVILVDDTSRLSRNLAEAMQLKQQFEFAGIRLIAVSQGVDSADDQADVIWTVHGLVDSLFLKELAKKTHRGMEGLALRGLHTGGRCYGYRSVPAEGGGARLTVFEPEALVVRRIFEMSANGVSLKKIAKTLNAEKVRSPQPGTKKRYDSWAPSAVREMLRRDLYVGKVVWNKSRKVKVPGTNKRVRRPRPESEWKVTFCPELRIISDELWNRVQQRIQFTLKTYGRNLRGMCNRNAASQYLLSGFLKCGECGANLVVVKGRASKYASYGCPQHYSRGACNNSLRIGLEKIEKEVFEHLQKEVLRPDVVSLAMQETKLEIEKLTRDSREMSNHRESRRKELETELRNLTTAVAKAAGNTSFLLEAIADREAELREIKRAFTVDQPKPVQLVLEGLEDHVMGAIPNIRELAQSDVPRAKVELGKHVDQIVLTPEPDHSGYLIEGQWTLVGSDNFQAILKECGVGMVPGGGVEPPRGVTLGRF